MANNPLEDFNKPTRKEKVRDEPLAGPNAAREKITELPEMVFQEPEPNKTQPPEIQAPEITPKPQPMRDHFTEAEKRNAQLKGKEIARWDVVRQHRFEELGLDPQGKSQGRYGYDNVPQGSIGFSKQEDMPRKIDEIHRMMEDAVRLLQEIKGMPAKLG